jgi:hypothetical protein
MNGYIIILIILLIIFVPKIIYEYQTRTSSIKNININDIKFRTGDVITCQFNQTAFNISNDGNLTFFIIKINEDIKNAVGYYLTGFYMHAAVVIVLNNVPYILDFTNDIEYCHYEKDFLIAKPVLKSIKYLNRYYGNILYYAYTGLTIPDKNIYKTLNEKTDIKFINTDLDLIRKTFKIDLGKYMVCVNSVTKSLTDFGILHNNHDYKNDDPQSLRNFLTLSNLYDSPRFINNKHYSEFYLNK